MLSVGPRKVREEGRSLEAPKSNHRGFNKMSLIFFFFVFLPFLGPLLQHMEIPRLGV